VVFKNAVSVEERGARIISQEVEVNNFLKALAYRMDRR
jgi:hypothetical protein